MKKGSVILVGVVGLAAILIFIGRSQNNQSDQASNTNQSANIGNQAEAQLAPELNLELLSGGIFNLADYRGKKAVVLDFWASWCPNCRRDMPNLNRYHDKYKDKVEVIGINLHENKSTVQKFISSQGINFPIALDPQSIAARKFGIQYTNTHFLISKEGKLVRTIPGDIRESDIESLIQP